MRVVQQAHFPCLVAASAASVDIILSFGTGRAISCWSLSQSRNCGSCVIIQQRGVFAAAAVAAAAAAAAAAAEKDKEEVTLPRC